MTSLPLILPLNLLRITSCSLKAERSFLPESPFKDSASSINNSIVPLALPFANKISLNAVAPRAIEVAPKINSLLFIFSSSSWFYKKNIFF